MANEEVMRRYRTPAYREKTDVFCQKHAEEGGKLLQAAGDNPLCGDSLQISAWLDEDGIIRDIRYDGYGCSLCIASAEYLLEQATGRNAAEALALNAQDIISGLGNITVGRSRMRCVELSVQVLQRALEQQP